jgi:hypothetical protein
VDTRGLSDHIDFDRPLQVSAFETGEGYSYTDDYQFQRVAASPGCGSGDYYPCRGNVTYLFVAVKTRGRVTGAEGFIGSMMWKMDRR